MLSQAVINDTRAIISKALDAGLIKFSEIAALARVVGALDVEERLFLEEQKKQTETPPHASKE